MNYLLLIFSVLAGAFLVILLNPNKKFINLLLAFSGAYLLSTVILNLLPEVYSNTSEFKKTGIFILIGVVLQSVLEYFSKGAEHGHSHSYFENDKTLNLMFISLCIHAFSEGLPISNLNHNVLWAIVVHKTPISIVLTTFFIKEKFDRKTTLAFLLFFAMMSPLGLLTGSEFPFFTNYKLEINAIIIGIFLHISTIILFEGSKNHKFNLHKFIAILLGILLPVLVF